jgi:hypothetical protein
MTLDDSGLKEGTAYIVRSRGAEVTAVTDMSANPDLAEVVAKLAEVIARFNTLVNELKSHHGLIA